MENKVPLIKTFSTEYLRNLSQLPASKRRVYKHGNSKIIGPDFQGSFQPTRNIVFESDVMCCAADGETLAVGLSNGAAKVLNQSRGTSRTLCDPTTVYKKLPVTCLQFRPGLLAAAYAAGVVKFWDPRAARCLRTIVEPQSTLALSYSADGMRLATAGSDAKVRIYDVETGKKLHCLERSLHNIHEMDGHCSRIFAVKYCPDAPHELVSSGWDRTLQFWDDRVSHSTRKISGLFVCGNGIDIRDNKLLTASWRKSDALQVWDYGTGRKLQDVSSGDFLYCCKFLGPRMAAAGGGGLSMVDLQSGAPLAALRNTAKPITCLDGSEAVLFTGDAETFHIIAIKGRCIDTSN